MDTVKKWLFIALLVSLIGLVVQTVILERELVAAARDRGKVGEVAHSEVKALKEDVLKEVATAMDGILVEVHGLVTGALRIADSGRADLMASVDAGREDLKSVMNDRGVVIDEQVRLLGSTSSTVLVEAGKAVIKADAIMARVQENSDLLLDCEGNPQCFPNRAIGTMQAIEGFADAGRDAMVEVKNATPEILDDAERVSDSLVVMADKGAESSAETVEVMKNIRKQTQPLPLAARIGGKFLLPVLGYIVGAVF